MPLTTEEHKQLHLRLHDALDELVADFIMHNRGRLPSETSVMDLLRWSSAQCDEPTPSPMFEDHDPKEDPYDG